MHKLNWYLARLSTMSIPELGYRAGQFFQKKTEKRSKRNVLSGAKDWCEIFRRSLDASLSNKSCFTIPAGYLKEFQQYTTFSFFTFQIDVDKPIDWHLDISSGKKFPLIFSKDIDIRSDKYGSAKVVWEINRLQFLLPIAIKYRGSKDKRDLQLFTDILQSWIAGNSYLLGVNWYSNIEVNIRLIVWYYCWQVLFTMEEVRNNKDFVSFATDIWLPAIYEHCVYSYANPSKYSSANNHLIAEYSGLFIASCCWDFNASKKWRAYAAKGLEKQIQAQHSPNGINKEEAAEYIQFITDFFLLPFSVGRQHNYIFSGEYENRLKAIFEYIYALMDIKKGYCKYGDEDDGKVLITSADPHSNNFFSLLASASVILKDNRFKSFAGGDFDLKNWLLWGENGRKIFDALKTDRRLRPSSLYDEGHFIFRKEDTSTPVREIYLHFDAAPLGFLSIAAHGHADALSIALHLDGIPFITDVGTYTYHTEEQWRNYFVSTLAHNTVCIDYKNQALHAGPTMWLNHYKVTVEKIHKDENIEAVAASHNGYLRSGCKHTRKVSFFRNEDKFLIEDHIAVFKGEHEIVLPWHLSPGIEVLKVSDNAYELRSEACDRFCTLICDIPLNTVSGQTDPVLGWYSPSFMQKTPTRALIGTIKNKGLKEIIIKSTININ
ncbi:MAG: alginate lyase family protein [Sphingobacteriales bacterium]|nr:alginate lyase family protein [Sphingobacteriales bacterium]